MYLHVPRCTWIGVCMRQSQVSDLSYDTSHWCINIHSRQNQGFYWNIEHSHTNYKIMSNYALNSPKMLAICILKFMMTNVIYEQHGFSQGGVLDFILNFYLIKLEIDQARGPLFMFLHFKDTNRGSKPRPRGPGYNQ